MKKKRSYGRGTEGNAFQVNDQPQSPDDSSPDNENGTQGKAFQVNSNPAEAKGEVESSA